MPRVVFMHILQRQPFLAAVLPTNELSLLYDHKLNKMATTVPLCLMRCTFSEVTPRAFNARVA